MSAEKARADRPFLRAFDPEAEPLLDAPPSTPEATVPPPPPTQDVATLRRGANAYLDHLGLRVELVDQLQGNAATRMLSPAHFDNIQRSLARFLNAWSVTLGDGRHVLVPAAEPWRRKPLTFSAATPEEAVAVAKQIASSLSSLPLRAQSIEALVRQNGDRPLAECLDDDLVRWTLANPQWASGHSKANNLIAIHDCYAWYAEETGGRSPYRRKRMPRFTKPSRRDASETEYVALMRHTSSRALRRALWTLWNTGIRTCELRELLWTDLDLEAGYALVFKHKAARKTGKPRLIGLSPRQRRFFRNLKRQAHAEVPHVFVNCEGDPWTKNSFGQHLRRTAKRIGLDEGQIKRVTAYCIRHTASTQAEEGGVSERNAATWQGNTPEMQRQVYSSASRNVQHVASVAKQVEEARRNSRSGRKKPKAKKQSLVIQGLLFQPHEVD